MAKALARKVISIANGTTELYDFYRQYRAELLRDLGSEKGQVYWSRPVGQYILAMRKGNNVILTFHAEDDCPCKLL
jgi:hypothetical protein